MFRHYDRRLVPGVAVLALLSACGGAPPPPPPAAASLDSPEIATALKGFEGSQIKQHMSVLADDALEGRGLGTPGYEGALQYVEKTLTGYGLAARRRERRLPAAGAAQEQRRRRRRQLDDGALRGRGRKTLTYGKDFLLGADPLREQVSIEDAPVAFVGYGVSAPALGYDDYGSGADVKGKVVAYLSGAPAMLPSNERAYYSSGAVKEAEAVEARRDRHDQLHVAGRSAIPLGRERRHQQAGRLRLGGRAGETQPRRSGAARVGIAQPFRRGGALCRGLEAAGRGLRGGREEHAAGVRPGDARVARDALDPQGRRERQPGGAPRGERRRRSRTNTSSTSPTWTTSGAAWR